jgi:hypothetical protein
MRHVRLLVVALGLSLAVPAEAATYSRDQASWYIGFAIGGGATWTRPYFEDAVEGSLEFQLEAGAVVLPGLLVGGEFDLSMSDTMAIGIGAAAGAALGSDEPIDIAPRLFFGPMVTWYPVADLGFHLKGGMGVCTTAFFPNSDSQAGFDLRTGLGWEFQIFESFNLGLEVQHGFEFYMLGWSDEVLGFLTMAWY